MQPSLMRSLQHQGLVAAVKAGMTPASITLNEMEDEDTLVGEVRQRANVITVQLVYLY